MNKTYSTGFAIKVTPEDRATDVMHHLTTGGLLGGRSLDGVTWEYLNNQELDSYAAKEQDYIQEAIKRAKADAGKLNIEYETWCPHNHRFKIITKTCGAFRFIMGW